MTSGILDTARLRALVANALDPATTEEARRTFAVRACEEISRLGLCDAAKVLLLVDRASTAVRTSPVAAPKRKAPPARSYRPSPQKVVVTAVPGSKKGYREVE